MWIPIALAAAGIGALVLPKLGPSRTPPPKPEPGQPGYTDWNMKPIVVDPTLPYVAKIRALHDGLPVADPSPPVGDAAWIRWFQSAYHDGAFWYTYPPPIELQVTGVMDANTMRAIDDAVTFQKNPYYVKGA